jgi:hypothetical protein
MVCHAHLKQYMSVLQSSKPSIPNTGRPRSTRPGSDAAVGIYVNLSGAVCLSETQARDWYHVCVVLFDDQPESLGIVNNRSYHGAGSI